jgi:peptidoglycan/xylan/chitin deacetylase (PgdA/CDA1 family)
VIEKVVEKIGHAAGARILKQWTTQTFDLGNHTYSHPDVDRLSIEQIEGEIVRGETTFAPLMNAVGKQPEFFRFPFNHTGDTKAKHDAMASFLSQRGYHLATCTIDTSDYLFNNAYTKMLAKKDSVSAGRLRRDYLTYTSVEIDYYAGLNRQVLGYESPQVMLLHDSPLNADTIEDILRIFEEKGYAFVSLKKAQSDPAYQIPDTDITSYGPMWGYRWAQERNVKVNGRLETDPPNWVLAYGQQDSPQQ